MKPRSDLCRQCQQNSVAIVHTANHPEHLRIVKMEREHYQTVCKECKQSVRVHFVTSEQFTPPLPSSHIPCTSKAIQVHYSFDYALQVHYPSDPLQPGPIYFLTPRKCTVFGVTCAALPRQINYLTDQAGDCGKDANTVISRIDYFANHRFGEKDNCTGPNKNNCMMQYILWVTLTNRHSNITLSFLPIGHMKFAPGWCFGLFKRAYRRIKVGLLSIEES